MYRDLSRNFSLGVCHEGVLYPVGLDSVGVALEYSQLTSTTLYNVFSIIGQTSELGMALFLHLFARFARIPKSAYRSHF
jgi:hypothetical protein